MDIGDSNLDIRELFWEVKTEIWLFCKTQKINSWKTVSQFTQKMQNIYLKYLAQDTIQRPDCVMGYFNVKNKENLSI